MAEEWRAYPFRQSIIQQIDEYLKQTPEAGKRSAADLENTIFQRATKKDEYLQYVSKIIMYLKDSAQNTNPKSSNLTAMLSGQHNANPGTVQQSSTGQGGVTSGGQMTLVVNNQSQLTGASQMGVPSQMGHTNVPTGQVGHVGVGGPSSGQNMVSTGMVTAPMTAGPNRMPQIMSGNMGNQADMSSWPSQPRGRRPNMTMKHPVAMTNMGGQQVVKMGGPMQMLGPNDQVPMNPMVGQIPRHMQHRVPSPSFNIGPQVRQGPSPNITSPIPSQHLAFVSPSSSAVPSPVSGVRVMNHHGIPSPSSMINTPGPQPSPVSNMGVSMEDRAYMDKVKQLQDKYLNTLRNVAQKLAGADSENAIKVRNLLEVIENPQRRAQNGMEVLKRCEMVLERIELQHGTGNARNDPDKNLHSKENNPVAVLFEAIQLALKSPYGYHTIHRTLSPALKTLMGPDLEPPAPKKFKSKQEVTNRSSESAVINDIIEGEVARLPPRFKVNLDCHQPMGSDNLNVRCQLDDPNLPCIPPITLIIPPNYPDAPPKCRLFQVDYDTTPFLRKVKEIMLNRLFHVPEFCSLTMLLEVWEMSVRRSCSNRQFIPDALDPLTNVNIFS